MPRTKVDSRPGRNADRGRAHQQVPDPAPAPAPGTGGIRLLANFCTGPYAATLSTSLAGDLRTQRSATWSLSEGPAMDSVLSLRPACCPSRGECQNRSVETSLGTQQPSGKNGRPGIPGGHVTCPGCSVLVRASNEMLCRVMPKQEPWAQPHGQSGIFPARPGNLREGPQSLACAYREPPAAYARRRLTSQQSLNLARGLLRSWRQLPKERGIQVTEELASCQRAARAVA